MVLPIFNSFVFKHDFPSYLLPKQINMILLLCHCKFSLCWRCLLKAPFLGALPMFLRIFVSSEGPLHPYHLPHPDLKFLLSLLCSFSISILSEVSVWFGSQTKCVTVCSVHHSYRYCVCPQSLSLCVSADIALLTGSQKCWCQPASQEHVSNEIQAHLCQDSVIYAHCCSPSLGFKGFYSGWKMNSTKK